MESAPTTVPVPSLLAALATVPDPRRRRGRRYPVAAVLTFAVCAMVCGARSLYAIAQWGQEQGSAEVRAALGIPRARTPSVATLFRLFRDLDPEAPGEDVPDPYYGEATDFDDVLDIVTRAGRALLDELGSPRR